jgi:hypothetical protein
MKLILHISVLALVSFYSLEAQNIRVVNMTPNSLSNESNQDSEPNLAVSPTDPLRIVGSAFTFNPTGATATAPVYISQDGGNTWVLNNIVPSLNGSTADITVGIGRHDTLYSGILMGGYVGPNDPQMQILRMANYLAAGTMINPMWRQSSRWGEHNVTMITSMLATMISTRQVIAPPLLSNPLMQRRRLHLQTSPQRGLR